MFKCRFFGGGDSVASAQNRDQPRTTKSDTLEPVCQLSDFTLPFWKGEAVVAAARRQCTVDNPYSRQALPWKCLKNCTTSKAGFSVSSTFGPSYQPTALPTGNSGTTEKKFSFSALRSPNPVRN